MTGPRSAPGTAGTADAAGAGDAGHDADLARIFHEAQRSADTIFSHYQLSQLLATHELPGPMAEAVLDELVHVCGAQGGAIWLARPDGAPELVAGSGPPTPPASEDGWVRVELEDVGLVALAAPGGRPLDDSAQRFLSLVRHELAIALRGALLREQLERERAELAAVFQGASDAIVLVDADRRITRVNPAAERLVGRPAHALLGLACDAALGCDVDERGRACGGRCPFAEVLAGGDQIDGAERSVGGATSVVGSYAVTSRGAEGRLRAVGILRDTSELARLAELRRGFLGSVSHELRTPLALLKGYVETLLDLEPDAVEARGILARADAVVDRLGTMVAQIIDASQVAAGHLDLDLAPLRLAGVAREAARELAARTPGLAVRLLLDDEAVVLGDALRLRQVVDNLLANSAKYGDAEAGVDVRVGRDGDMVELRVEDRGIGIPSDERELVFEQFHRARNVRERSVPGSGLGLAISRRIVEAHGGTIGVDPAHAEGSVLVVRLPAHRTGTVAVPVGARGARA